MKYRTYYERGIPPRGSLVLAITGQNMTGQIRQQTMERLNGVLDHAVS
jgi:hypothetical protein